MLIHSEIASEQTYNPTLGTIATFLVLILATFPSSFAHIYSFLKYPSPTAQSILTTSPLPIKFPRLSLKCAKHISL